MLQCLQDTKKLLRHDMMEDLERTINEECKLFLKYLSDEQFVSSLASIWKPEVEVFLWTTQLLEEFLGEQIAAVSCLTEWTVDKF